MKTGTFITEVESGTKITVPVEISERINLKAGDKVEILLKKIRSKKLDLNIGKNPLYKLLTISELK